MTTALLLSLVATGPFQDTQNRFSLQLPEGWVFAPQPGDLHGATFTRNLDGIPASAAVRVIDLSGGSTLASFARHVAEASRNEPGYQTLIDDAATLCGQAARRHRFVMYVAGDPKWPKMVEQRVIVAHNVGYVVHVETIADAFGTFEKDFMRLFSGFHVGPGPGQNTGDAVPMPHSLPDWKRLIGKWAGAGHTMHLSPSGVVLLDKDHGRYQVRGGLIILRLATGRAHLRYELGLDGDTVRVQGGRFGRGKILKRQ